MSTGNSKADVAHAFTTDSFNSDFNTAFFADFTSTGGFLVFSATALVILDRTEDFFGKEALWLWFKRTIVDGFVFGDFVFALIIARLLDTRPAFDLLWAGKSDLDRMKFVQFKHDSVPP